MTLERLQRWPEAERDLRQALALQPNEPNVLNYLGYSFIDRGANMSEGRNMIEAALRQRPDDGYIVDSLGWAQYSAKQWDAAVATLERAVAIEPGDPTINEHLGDAYWRVGRLLEARFRWNAAKSLDAEPEQSARLDEKSSSGWPKMRTRTIGRAKGSLYVEYRAGPGVRSGQDQPLSAYRRASCGRIPSARDAVRIRRFRRRTDCGACRLLSCDG
ncbi:tetratricopeptide repeat protein [Hankyongella ginsenosidimutans]|uniref:Tetratricopeptide repeat protein n=1 Tax=Hankyongella ginsenosidimutans TaxID=1763828 RepID=A0A4D7CC96_9SPHN|nr:tetratricopeptide repeat protein [Hankyongella ginsenosidimutans]QCI80062.1 tetratricopeptide repeat protein [Hankyongella ginsenosidimutans]